MGSLVVLNPNGSPKKISSIFGTEDHKVCTCLLNGAKCKSSLVTEDSYLVIVKGQPIIILFEHGKNIKGNIYSINNQPYSYWRGAIFFNPLILSLDPQKGLKTLPNLWLFLITNEIKKWSLVVILGVKKGS